MFWNKHTRRWEPHPLCTCHGPTGTPADAKWWDCICTNLPPLDRDGMPIGPHGFMGVEYPTKEAGDERERRYAVLRQKAKAS